MGESIQEMYDKFKSFLADDTFYYTMVVLLVGVLAFGLGRWSAHVSPEKRPVPYLKTVQNEQKASVYEAQNATNTQNSEINGAGVGDNLTVTTAEQKKYVGSKSGTKYHLLTCPGAKQIKEENKIYFSSKEEAQKMGYSPAANCNGI